MITDPEELLRFRYVSTTVPYIGTQLYLRFLLAIAEVYNDEGDEEYRKKEFNHAIQFYTEGLEVNCKDDELNAKLYSNRATANFNFGKI